MRGTIDVANPARGRFSALMDDGSFIAFELQDSVELSGGDNFTCVLRGNGGQDFRLSGNGQQFAVFVEMIGASRIAAGTWAAA